MEAFVRAAALAALILLKFNNSKMDFFE